MILLDQQTDAGLVTTDHYQLVMRLKKMGCCGKVKNIIKANVFHWLEEQFKVSIEKCLDTEKRVRICQRCDRSTWLTLAEYYEWVNEQGKINVLKNLDDLSSLPDLPKRENHKRAKLFCVKCKCFIPAKARLKYEKCILNKW